MDHRVVRFHEHVSMWHHVWTEVILAVALVLLVFVSPASAALRMQDRSLYMASVVPGATTSYKVSFSYMSAIPIGSVDMLFCIDPIPYHPCDPPPGLDVSGAALSEQTGETGFSLVPQSQNHFILSRPAMGITTTTSSYKFDNIVNPTNPDQSFSIRLRSHTTLDATGPQVDFGSVKGQVTRGIIIETQVPPMLIFCLAQEVEENCTSTNDTFYTDMGVLESGATLVARSQMAVGTNATGGFAITANGIPPSAGVNSIDPNATPTASIPGTNQFGINLVANSDPAVGNDPEGIWANAVAAADYGIPNQYKYVSGDVVAYSPNVSLMKKFTVSYVVNSSDSLRPGVYTTTITYIASGQF